MSSGRYKPYSKYHDSGAKWLGDIPVHWAAKRLGQFFDERRDKVSDKNFAPLSVTMQGIVPQLETAAKTDDGDNRKLVRANDFVINSRSDRKGSAGVSSLDGSVSLISTVLTPRNIEPRYVHHLLRSYPFQEEFYRFGKGIVADLWSTNYSEMKNILIPELPRHEQTQIATFLDHETAKIDGLIEKQQALISLLKEKRQAVISHAVTKGLNPHAPLKDSGIEWLGQVPAHWEVKKFNHCATIRNGQVDPRIEPYRSMILYAPNHIEKETGRVLFRETAEEQGADSGKYLCLRGEVIYSKIRPSLAKAAICTEEKAMCSADMYPIKAENGLSDVFLLWFLLTPDFTATAVLDSERVAMPKINREKLGDYKIPVPPLAEQAVIVGCIEKMTASSDKLIAQAESAATLLQERRTALISAAVTGKIDVRHWQPAASKDN